jgi:hypothetical protein
MSAAIWFSGIFFVLTFGSVFAVWAWVTKRKAPARTGIDRVEPWPVSTTQERLPVRAVLVPVGVRNVRQAGNVLSYDVEYRTEFYGADGERLPIAPEEKG